MKTFTQYLESTMWDAARRQWLFKVTFKDGSVKELEGYSEKYIKRQYRNVKKAEKLKLTNDGKLSEGRTVKVPQFRNGSAAQAWIRKLDGSSKPASDVVDPDTGEILMQKGEKRKKAGRVRGIPKDGEFAPMLSDMDYGSAIRDAKKFYTVTEGPVSRLAHMGNSSHDYDLNTTMPILIKRKDGAKFDEDDEDNMNSIRHAWKRMADNMELSWHYRNGRKVVGFDVSFN